VKNVKLVVSGSGTRYPVQIGAICELLDMGFKFPELLGASGGAIASAAAARYATSDELEKLAMELLPKKFLTRNWFPFGGRAGLYTTKGLTKAFEQSLHENIEDGHSRLHIATTNWTKGKTVVWREGKLAPRLCASICLPIFDMVEIEGDLYEDGGTMMNFGLNYKGWFDAVPNVPVLGLKIRGKNDLQPRPSPPTKIHRADGTISNMLAAQDREHIESAHWASVVILETSAPGMNLGMDEKDVAAMIKEGREAIKQAYITGRLG